MLFLNSGLTAEVECTDCVGGMVCDETGLSYPRRECGPGYFCRIRAQSTTPNQGEMLSHIEKDFIPALDSSIDTKIAWTLAY